jgi:hypothetical protein
MNFDTLTPIIGFVGSLALVIMGLCLAKVLHQLRQVGKDIPAAMPSKTVNALVVVACVIAMLCAAARAWQFSLLGH